MDPSVVAASLYGEIHVASRTMSTMKDYFENFRDAREEIAQLYSAVLGISRLLLNIKDNIRGSNSGLLMMISDPLLATAEELQRLSTTLSRPQSVERRRLRTGIKCPIQRAEVEKHLVELQRCRTRLILATGIGEMFVFSFQMLDQRH